MKKKRGTSRNRNVKISNDDSDPASWMGCFLFSFKFSIKKVNRYCAKKKLTEATKKWKKRVNGLAMKCLTFFCPHPAAAKKKIHRNSPKE